LKKRDISVTITESNILFKKLRTILNLVKRLSYCTKVKSYGKKTGGKTLALPSDINEAESIQTNGITVMIPVIIKNPYKNIFFNLFKPHRLSEV
jgi:hypothetical protein